MKFRGSVGLLALGASVGVTVSVMPQARAELVYEENAAPSTAQKEAEARRDDRSSMRQAISSSQKAKNTLAAERPQYAPPTAIVRPVIQVQPVVQQSPALVPAYAVAQAPTASPVYATDAPMAAAPASVEVQNLSKTELMRRERVRAELQNEDVLQERLEELRLRDEKRRTQDLLTGKALDANGEAAAPAQGQGLRDEAVMAPVTERPGQGLPQPPVTTIGPAPANNVASAYPQGYGQPVQPMGNPNGYPMGYQQESVATSAAMATSVSNPEDKTMLYIRPFAGIPNMDVNNAFDVRPHYAAGVGLGVGAGESLTFDIAYTFADYGVNLASTNPWVATAQNFAAQQGQTSALESLTMKQNIFEAGLRLHLLNTEAKVRPFLGGGAGYSKSYINYSQGYLQSLRASGLTAQTTDYEASSYLGYLTTGFDIRLNKAVSLGGNFKYYSVLSSNENSQVAYQGFASPYGGFPAFPNQATADKSAVGASLSTSSFYTITGGATFVF